MRLSRKHFLIGTGAALLARCGPPMADALTGGHPVGVLPGDAGADAGEADAGVTHDAGEPDAGAVPDAGPPDAGPPDAGVTPQCPETAYDQIGPCHRPNAPLRTLLSQPGDGPPLFITGLVTGKGCGVIADAEIDLWHANTQGTYSDLNVCGGTDGATFRWRGRQLSRADGSWGFESIYPGSFQNRPIHIHMRVSAPGYRPLITQIYFQDDPFLPNEGPKPPTLVIVPRYQGVERHGVFNIVLAAV